MAEQAVSPQATVVVTGAAPLAHHHGEASPSPSPQGSSFVKAIDRKARSYLKTLERSFSFSMPDTRAEDPSSMTIEFLRARLQAQRAEYKAEKQRAQQLAKKVLELEQRLNFEIEQRNKAECNDMTSPCYRNTTPNCKSSQSSMEREGLVLINSKFKENSSGEEDYSDRCSEISGSEGHLEGDGVVLISPSSLQRHWKSLRLEHQHSGNQHGSYVANEINAASVMDKESITLNHKESREKPCEAAYCVDPLEGPEGLVDLDSTNSQVVMTKFMQGSTSETLNASPAIDSQSLRIANTVDIRASRQKGPSETGHIVFQAYLPRQASTIYDADRGFTSESSQHQMNATKATSCHSNNYIARPIDNCKNRQQTFSRSPISPCDKLVATNLTPQRGKNLQDSQASLKAANAKIPASDTSKGTTNTYLLPKSLSIGNDRILEYLVGHCSHKIQEMQEEGPSLRRHEDESKYVKDILSPSTIQIQEIIRSSEKPLHAPCNNGSFSAVQARHRWKLHGRRMSLDGGLDWLQEAGKAVEDVQAAKFKNYVLNHYY